jgi:hypothetical protein
MQGPQMSPDVFAKDGFPEEIRLELEKLRLAHAIGESSNLFCVPEILDVDVPAGRLHLEHLTGLRTLAELAASDDPGLMPALRLLGRSLSAVHEQLRLSEEDTIPLPDEWMGLDDENAYLHGDLTVCNVGWDDSTGRLVMFDWALSRIIGVPATYGSRYFDLAWFVRSVFWSRGGVGLSTRQAGCATSSSPRTPPPGTVFPPNASCPRARAIESGRSGRKGPSPSASSTSCAERAGEPFERL